VILRRLSDSLRNQDWATVLIEIVIVVVGVFLGIQASNWNDGRKAQEQRTQVTRALVTGFQDAINVSRNFISGPIEDGMTTWQAAFERGEQPPPFFFTMQGSDLAPNTLNLIAQAELSELFDPATLFDLGYYFAELDGTGRKYIRYVAFVESDILPNLYRDPAVFYSEDGVALKPEYVASMDRLGEYATDTQLLTRWAECLVYRIESPKPFESLCRRSGYRLEGMPEPGAKP